MFSSSSPLGFSVNSLCNSVKLHREDTELHREKYYKLFISRSYGVGSVCGVWADEWTQLDLSQFGGSSAWVIKEDTNHKIWIGTENGIYIR